MPRKILTAILALLLTSLVAPACTLTVDAVEHDPVYTPTPPTRAEPARPPARAPGSRTQSRGRPARPPSHAPAPAPAPAVYVISSGELSRLIARIENESFSSGRLRVLEDAAEIHWFTAAQVRLVLGAFTFENKRLEALGMMVHGIVDPENAYEIYEAFRFESSKRDARRIVRTAHMR